MNAEKALLRASEILPAHLLRGPGYVVNEPIEIRENNYLFRLQTDYGEVMALGMPMLHRRLQEHVSIQSLRQKLYSPMIFHGVLEAVREAPAGAFTLLTDPVGSLLRFPRGLRLSLRAMIDPLERRGGGEVRRGLAHAVHADPETRNPVLAALLDHLALRKQLGKTAMRVGLSKVVPYWQALAAREKNRIQVSQQRPRQVARNVTARLVELGIPRTVSKEFATSMVMTSSEKLLAIVNLELLRGVHGLDQLVASCSHNKTETELLSYLQSLRLLSELHQQDPIESVQADWISLARLRNGCIIAFAAVDILHGSQRLCTTIERFCRRIASTSTYLLVSGVVTMPVKASLRQAGIVVIDLSHETAALRAA